MGNQRSSQIMDLSNEVMQNIMQSVWQNNETKIANVTDISQFNDVTIAGLIALCKNFKFSMTNKIAADINYVDNISVSVSNTLKGKLESEIDNKTSQIQKIVRDVALNNASDEQITQIKNRVNQIISTNISTQNLNNILRSTIAKQGNKLNFSGIIFGDTCELTASNDFQYKLVANTVASTITTTIVDDAVINRIVNDVKQSQEIVQLGLTTLISAMASLFLAIGASLSMAGSGVGGPVVSLIFKIFMVVLCLFLIYLPIAYFFEWWPFRNGHWGCEMIDGIATGRCVQISRDDPDFSKKGIFVDEDACNDAVKNGRACFQYWGCVKKDGLVQKDCTRYQKIIDGPYATKEKCEQAILDKKCNTTWGCEIDENTGYTTGRCKEFNQSDYPSLVQSKNDCLKDQGTKCGQHWSCIKQKNGKCKCEQLLDGSAVAVDYMTQNICNEHCNESCK